MVIPGRKHLWELKSIVYEKPYENNPKSEYIEGFKFLKRYNVQKEIALELNISINTIESQMAIAYKKLRVELKDVLQLFVFLYFL